MPHKFFAEACKSTRIVLPEPGQYGVGLVFLPRNPTVRRKVEESPNQPKLIRTERGAGYFLDSSVETV